MKDTLQAGDGHGAVAVRGRAGTRAGWGRTYAGDGFSMGLRSLAAAYGEAAEDDGCEHDGRRGCEQHGSEGSHRTARCRVDCEDEGRGQIPTATRTACATEPSEDDAACGTKVRLNSILGGMRAVEEEEDGTIAPNGGGEGTQVA